MFQSATAKLGELGAVIIDDDDFDNWKPNAGQREDLFGDILLREGSRPQLMAHRLPSIIVLTRVTIV